MTTGGLGATDTGNTAAIQGIAREFYNRVGAAYGLSGPEWNFEPHVAQNVLDTWIAGSRHHRGHRPAARSRRRRVEAGRPHPVDRNGERPDVHRLGVHRRHVRRRPAGRPGVSYSVGREANAAYGETYNGVQVARATSHQFSAAVDPYVVAGNPASGLLPGIKPAPPGDRRLGRQPRPGLQLSPHGDQGGQPAAVDRAGRLRPRPL